MIPYDLFKNGLSPEIPGNGPFFYIFIFQYGLMNSINFFRRLS